MYYKSGFDLCILFYMFYLLIFLVFFPPHNEFLFVYNGIQALICGREASEALETFGLYAVLYVSIA